MIKLIWKGDKPPKENEEKYIWINGNEYKVWNGIDWEDLPLSTDEKIDESLLPDSIVRKSEFSTLIEDLGIHSGTDGKDGTNGKDGQDGQDGINGRDGVDGQDGEDGLGIKDQFDYYLTTNSTNIDGTEPVDEYPVAEAYDVWQKEFVTNVTEGHQYLWHRIKTIYTDDTTIKTSKPVIIRRYIDFDSSALEEEVNTIIDNKIQNGDFDEPIESVISEGLGEDGNINAAIVSAKEAAITQAVTKGQRVWVKWQWDPDLHDYVRKGDTLPVEELDNEGDPIAPEESDPTIDWRLEYIAASISGINIKQDRITSAILDENGEVKAGIDIIGDAANEEGSKIVLTADNVEINGGLSTTAVTSSLVNSKAITADMIAADTVTASRLRAKAENFETVIEPGVFKILLKGKTVAEFMLDDTQQYVKLRFFGPDGWCDISGAGTNVNFDDIEEVVPKWIAYKIAEFSSDDSTNIGYYLNGASYIDDIPFDVPQMQTYFLYSPGYKKIGNNKKWYNPETNTYELDNPPALSNKLFTTNIYNSNYLYTTDNFVLTYYPSGRDATPYDPQTTSSRSYVIYWFDVFNITGGVLTEKQGEFQGKIEYLNGNRPEPLPNNEDIEFSHIDDSSWDDAK